MERVPFDAMKGQGQSIDATIDKERCLGSALTIGMKIANAHFAGWPYWHFDATAGSGHNDIVDVPGSPVVFHVAADTCLTAMKRQGFFCDKNVAALKELKLRLGKWMSSSYLLPGDNEEALEVFAERIRQSGDRPRYAVGSVIVDPNGYWYRNKTTGDGPPIAGLLRFVAEFPRIDIILNLNARIYRLQRANGHHVNSPQDVLINLRKSNWLVRHTRYGSSNDWLLAVGRNVATGDHRKIEFHRLDSEKG
ncbi:MAG: hypothetical protein WAN04_08860, partial [Candidatus Udaeobacter sp.]